MGDIYVLIGDQQQQMQDSPTGLVELLVQQEVLDNTYQGFLAECAGLLETEVTPIQRPVYDTMRAAIRGEDKSITYEVIAYNRSEGTFEQFRLDENVRDTAGPFIFSQEHEIDGVSQVCKTLEMYIRGDEMGG